MSGKASMSRARRLQKNWASPEDQKVPLDLRKGRGGGDVSRQKCEGSQRRALFSASSECPKTPGERVGSGA